MEKVQCVFARVSRKNICIVTFNVVRQRFTQKPKQVNGGEGLSPFIERARRGRGCGAGVAVEVRVQLGVGEGTEGGTSDACRRQAKFLNNINEQKFSLCTHTYTCTFHSHSHIHRYSKPFVVVCQHVI